MRHEDDDSWLDRAAQEAHRAIARIHADGLAALDETHPGASPRPGAGRARPRDVTSTGWFEPISEDTPPPY